MTDKIIPDITLVFAPCLQHTGQPPAGIPCLVSSLDKHGYVATAIDGDMGYKKSLSAYGFYYKCIQALFLLRDKFIGPLPMSPSVVDVASSERDEVASTTMSPKKILRNAVRAGYLFVLKRLISLMNASTPNVGGLLNDIFETIDTGYIQEKKWMGDRVVPQVVDAGSKIIGISIVYPDQVVLGLLLAKRLKDIDSDYFIILGGAQITAHIEKFRSAPKQLDFIDAMMVHEGEVGLRELLAAQKAGTSLHKVSNLYFRDNGEFVESENANFQMPLTEYTVPDFTGFNIADYGHILPIRTLRGCYYNKCTFCTYPVTGGKFAYTSTKFVVDNIEALQKKYGISTFEFIDSSMPAKYLKQISEMIIERNLKVSYICRANVQKQFADPELLTILRKGGCAGLYLGVESGTERIVKLMGKMQSRQHGNDFVVDVVKSLRDHGIKPSIYNMFGFPSETLEEMQAALEFLMMLNKRFGCNIRYANQFNFEENTPVALDPEKFGITKIYGATNASQGYGRKYDVSSGASQDETAAFCRRAQVFLRYPALFRAYRLITLKG